MKPVFIHISKNAGTSIKNTADASIIVAGHRPAANWIKENGNSGTLFTVIRNPFDRVVSEYFFRRDRFLRGEKNPHLANLGKSFDEWVISTYRNGEYRSKSFFNTHQVPYNKTNMIGDCLLWFLPQIHWIADDKENIVVDEILRYETLTEDWNRFTTKFGMNSVLAHKNISNRRRDYRNYYSPASFEIVNEYFRADLEEFEYSFD